MLKMRSLSNFTIVKVKYKYIIFYLSVYRPVLNDKSGLENFNQEMDDYPYRIYESLPKKFNLKLAIKNI